MSRVIDANLSWFPEELFTDTALCEQFLSEIPVAHHIRGSLKEQDGLRRFVIEKPVGSPNLDYIQGDYTLEKELSALSQAGVDAAVLKLSCQQEWMSLDMCRYFNTRMAERVQESNGHLFGLGVVPPMGTPAVFREIDRCLDELGFGGLQLSAHYGDLYLDDEAFAPFFAYLNERGLVHSMLGGGFFAYINLWFPGKPKVKEAFSRFKDDNELVLSQLRSNLFFEMSHAQPWGREQLTCAVHTLGADHILFGSSYPVRPVWLMEGADFVRSLEIPEEEKELILHGNAERLYHL